MVLLYYNKLDSVYFDRNRLYRAIGGHAQPGLTGDAVYGYSQQGGQSVRRTVVNCAKPRGGTNAVLPTGSGRCVDHKVLCIADGHIKRTTADESEKGINSSK